MRNAAQYGNEPTLASLLELVKKGTKKEINCHQVGEIVSFDSDNQTAEVQIKMSYIVNGEIKQYPLLVDCPCVVLGGGQGRITFPIKEGDGCLVLFNDRDIDNWFSGGQTMQPRTERAHSFSDAIALVGIRNMQNKITDYLSDGTELKYGTSTIKLEDNKVTVTDSKDTITLNNGTVTITDGKATVVMSNGTVTITADSVSVVTPSVSFSGNVAITGNATISGEIVVQDKNIGPNHTHPTVFGNTGGVN